MSSPSPKVVTDIAVTNMGYKNAFDTLLADIPALSVGLLGFAFLTFFILLKKVKLASFLLQISVLFSFFAAIVDLTGASLRHGNSNLVRLEEDNVTNALSSIREALCSIASGLRFLYFWAFVSQAPLCEQRLASYLTMHSGSWLHWGRTGTVLRWSTLVASVSIFVLQALWRLVHSLRRFGPVYDVESAFEITASGIYIIKLILNALIVEESCRRQTLWQYSTAFFALVINSGIGIGNLLYFTFSDTALGRLLLAIELYILIVSTMVFTFYSSEPTSAPLSLRDKRASSFVGLHVSKIDADQGLAGEDDANTTGSPRPTVQRALSWLRWSGSASQRLSSQFRPSYEDGGQPRSEEAAERGVISSPSEKRVPLAVPDDIQPSSVDSSIPDYITQRIPEGFSLSTTQLPADTVYGNGRPSTTMSATTTTSPDSPILGADGIAEAQGSDRASRKPREPGYSSTTSSQLSGYEDLLREQDQLERSIAALKTVFEQGRSEGRRRDESSNTVSRLSGRSRLRESSTTAYGPTSASNRSDFSLSIFPEPPEQGVTENLSRIRPRSSSVPALTPTQISFGIGRSFPVSTAGIDGVAVLALGGMESAGTHYDVTSFIGGASAMFPFWGVCS
ncbi:hypothetical protein F5888DRAFT_72939 [Russula emetica]|nr:hypothetical protein F5888DRAFT_72939 [Russula emetica]